MKLSVEDLNGALKRALPAVARGSIIPSLSHIWFQGGEITAYDGGLGVHFKFKTGLDLGVPGHTLSKLLATTALAEVELEADGKGTLAVKLGKSTSKLAALDVESCTWPFPDLPAKAKPIHFNETVIEGLRKALLVKASPVTRVEHNGIMVQIGPGGLELYATDSASMVRVIVKLEGKPLKLEPVLLPRGFVEQLVAEAPEGVDFFALEDCLIANSDRTTFYSNLLDLSEAEELDAVFEKCTDHLPKGVPLPAGLKGALERAEVLSGQEDPFVTLKTKGNALKLTARYRLGTVDEELELEGKHPAAEITLYAPRLQRALVYSETFTFDEKAILLEGGDDFAFLLAAKG